MKIQGLGLWLVIFLTSCNVKPFFMEKVNINLTISSTYLILKSDEYNNKINSKEDFILYIFSPYCDICNDFKKMLDIYINKYKCEIFAYNINDCHLNLQYEIAPTIFIFNEGKVYKKIDMISNCRIFESYDHMRDFFNKYIFVKSFRDLNNENELQDIMKLDNVLIYYYYRRCSDCIYFDDNFFSSYLKNTQYHFYGFEMSDYFQEINDFYVFCDKYNLSDNQDEHGYLNGVVPFFQKYEKGYLKNDCVIFNDVFEKKYNEDGELISLKIISSFYEDNPYINVTFNHFNNKSPKKMYYETTFSFFYDKFCLFLSNNPKNMVL